MNGPGPRFRTMGDTIQSTPTSPHLPDGFANAFGFAAFNALSFQMVLGSPMVLYAKSLGASATVLGLITGMLPLLVILQIPAARHVDRVGQKKFVLSGWSVRQVFVVLLAAVPLTASVLEPPTRLAIVLALLFAFNVSRGISSCGWLPWITSLIPKHWRGRYLAREAAIVNVASLFAFWIAALALGDDPPPLRFSLLFAFSAVTGVASLVFLARIPEEPRRSDHLPVPPRPGIGAMIAERPFARLLVFNMAWSVASGGVLTFAVSFLKGMAAFPERTILVLSSAIFVGGALAQLRMARIMDRFGSRRLLVAGGAGWAIVLAGWCALAGGLLPAASALVAGLMLAIGLCGAAVNLANIRLAMAVIPEAGRSHFFAVYSVVGSVTLGLSPIGWGMLVDGFHDLALPLVGGAFLLNRFSLLFAILAVLFVVAALLARRLEEPEAPPFEELVRGALERPRTRIWMRPWFRPPPRGG